MCLTSSLRADPVRTPYLVATERGGDAPPARFAREDLLERRYERLSAGQGYVLDLTAAEAEGLAGSDGVRFVEPDAERFVYATPRLNEAQQMPWGATMVNAPSMWFLTRGEGARVGIIDTGIDLRHPDLQNAYRGGWDFVHNDAIPEEEAQGEGFSHGTRMASIIAATDNGLGLVGVAPGVSLYALKIFGKSGGALTSNVIRAIDWAIAQRLDVLTCSFGGDTPTKLEEEAFARARRANILVIAAVGNHASHVRYPAAYPSVVGVGAIDRSARVAWFSNTGSEVEFVAPGVDLLTATISAAGRVASITLDDNTVISAHPLMFSRPATAIGHGVECVYGGAADFPGEAAGNIALVQPDSTLLSRKATNAISAGVAAVVLINDRVDDMPLRGSLGSASPLWPVAVSVSAKSGQLIRERGGILTVDSYSTDYETSDGASLSAPHVAAVAALVRALRPDFTADEILALMAATARDLGAEGRDPIYGYGLIDAYAAAAAAAPERMPTKRRRSAGR
jgi:subtilisin family serine protease